MTVEQFDQLGEVRQGAGQSVHLVDDDDVDLSGPHIVEQLLQCRAVDIATGEAAIVIFGSDQSPTGMGLAPDIRWLQPPPTYLAAEKPAAGVERVVHAVSSIVDRLFQTGVRESAQSWRELLVDVKRRGLEIAPDLAVGDGALGFWKAIEEVFPGTRHQRCWVHKTANVLNKVPLSVQVNMKADLREIYGAPTRAAAEIAIDVFADKYGAKYDKAVACLTKDREALLAFFDFPAEHWDHLRTSNPIESVFATVRHRTVRTKGSLSPKTAKLMVFKLVSAAAKTWRRLKGENQLPKVVRGVKFQNGVEVIEMPAHNAA